MNRTEEEFPCIFFYAGDHKGAKKVSFHTHHAPELLFQLEGSCRVETPVGNETLHRGDVLYIPRGVSHNQINSEGERNIYCVFSHSGELFETSFRKWSLTQDPWVSRLLFALLSMTLRGDHLGAEGILYTLLVRLSHFEESRGIHAEMHPAVRKTIHFFGQKFRSPVTVAEAARHAGMSESRLRKLFLSACGVSPKRYLIALRLSLAENLLRNEYYSISEAAALSGFENPNYFARLYKKYNSRSPEETRRRMRRTQQTVSPAF